MIVINSMIAVAVLNCFGIYYSKKRKFTQLMSKTKLRGAHERVRLCVKDIFTSVHWHLYYFY